MLTSREIRQSFIDFFRSREHAFVPSSSVVPTEDPTLLFTNAGMNQFKDIFLGMTTRDYTRAVNSQKCIRVSGKHNDLEEVGKDTYHHTFFEMLGNWSFGDYFKAEAIEWAWELITNVWQVPANKLWATVFGGDSVDGVPADTEAEQLWWDRTSIAREHVLRFGRKDNFWEMGDTGPCGPCSELHLDLGPDRCDKQHVAGHICQVNGDCGRYIELWNLVFIQYNRDDGGKLHELPSKHVDTGAGLERVVAVLQNKGSNYDTDLFSPIMARLTELSGKQYTAKLGNDIDNAFRVISDHIRTLTFAIADGATPSNDGRGYVLRRILRRATRFGLVLDLHETFLYKLVPTVVELMGEVFPEIKARAEHVVNVVQAEEDNFRRTLERGVQLFEQDVAELEAAGGKALPGAQAFRLYDTYGFPLDLTQLMAEERGLSVDVAGFEKLMAQQRELARASQKNQAYQADALADRVPATDDAAKYHAQTLHGRLLGYVQDDRYVTEGPVPTDTRVGLVFDRTCAYAEAGGQAGDSGTIAGGGAGFAFDDTRRIGAGVAHFGLTAQRGLEVGRECVIRIDPAREDVRRNHTATHLLQWALRTVLGEHVHQEGSLVTAEQLRFDFTHPKALTGDEIRRIEQLVRDKIDEGAPVNYKVMGLDEARELGAMALFSEKYGEQVRVLAIGAESKDRLEEAFSREFCGGTHVSNTAEIGSFKIVREESVATGIRRITALTGRGLNRMVYERCDQVDELATLLKTTPEQLFDRVSGLVEENKKLKKQLKKGAAGDVKAAAQALLGQARSAGDVKVIVGAVPAAGVEAVRGEIDWLRKKAGSCAIVLGMATEDGKVMLFAAMTDDVVDKGVKAGDVVKEIAPIVGGGGGGRPQMAQAGGKDPAKLDAALDRARAMINEKLA